MSVWPEECFRGQITKLWNKWNKKNWAFNLRKFFISNQSHHLANVEHLYLAEMVITNVDSILWEAEKVKWLTSINREEAQHGVGKNKLRSYNTFKQLLKPKPMFNRANLPRAQRRALAQFRAGVAPLALETGRYQGLPVRERICFHCKSLNRETVEDEKHVILTCPLYNAQRATLFTRLEESIQGFSYISEEQKFKTILSDGNNVKQCASFLKTILEIRRSELMKPQGHWMCLINF